MYLKAESLISHKTFSNVGCVGLRQSVHYAITAVVGLAEIAVHLFPPDNPILMETQRRSWLLY